MNLLLENLQGKVCIAVRGPQVLVATLDAEKKTAYMSGYIYIYIYIYI